MFEDIFSISTSTWYDTLHTATSSSLFAKWMFALSASFALCCLVLLALRRNVPWNNVTGRETIFPLDWERKESWRRIDNMRCPNANGLEQLEPFLSRNRFSIPTPNPDTFSPDAEIRGLCFSPHQVPSGEPYLTNQRLRIVLVLWVRRPIREDEFETTVQKHILDLRSVWVTFGLINWFIFVYYCCWAKQFHCLLTPPLPPQPPHPPTLQLFITCGQ